MQEALSLDRDYEMRESREGTAAGEDRHRSRRASRRSWSALTGEEPELIPHWLSDLQSASVSLFPFAEPKFCGHLRFGSAEPKTICGHGRQGAESACICGHEKVPAGRLFGPIGRLFRPGGHGDFGVAFGASGPCVGQTCESKDRQQLAGGGGSSPLRLTLRLSLRLSLHLWLHRPIEPKAPKRRPQRGLRAWRFADISTQPPGRNIERNRGSLIVLSILSASLALAACAIASALAPQRFAGSTTPIALGATAIASALATHRLLASALASQRSGPKRPRAWRLA
jgi:hypothetical protein